MKQIDARFSLIVPDPEEEGEYFPSELLASALDPQTKALTFVPNRYHERVPRFIYFDSLIDFNISFHV